MVFLLCVSFRQFWLGSKQQTLLTNGDPILFLMKNNQETIILSLGGSLIVPDEIDINFLTSFKNFIINQIQLNKRFVIVCGGGKVCRRYQSALSEISPNSSAESKDWIGCKVTQLNAILIKHIFGDLAKIIPNFNPKNKFVWDCPIYVGAGFEPGHSTDMDTVLLAKTVGAKKLINLSNVEYIYTKDPKQFKNAKKLTNLSWDELIEILPKEWSPGLNAPFDPIAAKKAKEFNLEIAIISGKNLNQLPLFLEGKKFIGTTIKN